MCLRGDDVGKKRLGERNGNWSLEELIDVKRQTLVEKELTRLFASLLCKHLAMRWA